MEARARRRLALLSSHVNPLAETSGTTSFSSLFASTCACGDNGEKEITKGESDCVFCKIIRGEAPALKLYEDDECLCILDTYPLCHGHSLIIPKSHHPSLDATPPSIIGAMCSKVPVISNAVMKATGCVIVVVCFLWWYIVHMSMHVGGLGHTIYSFNLLVNNGAAAGQVIYHTHIHIIPRKANDCLWTSESLRRRPMKVDQEVSRLADRIRESLMFVNSYEDSKGQQGSTSLVVN